MLLLLSMMLHSSTVGEESSAATGGGGDRVVGMGRPDLLAREPSGLNRGIIFRFELCLVLGRR